MTSSNEKGEAEKNITDAPISTKKHSFLIIFFKVAASSLLVFGGFSSFLIESISNSSIFHRRLTDVSIDSVPTYMKSLFDDLKKRRELMEETPPDEVKYWFEYAGPLQIFQVKR